MNFHLICLNLICILFVPIFGQDTTNNLPSPEEILTNLRIDIATGNRGERIAVANRARGDALLIEMFNENAQTSLKLDENSEPMYISTSLLTDEMYIGDRANNKLFVYDTLRFRQKAVIPIPCGGIFHQVVNLINQLWITCDISKKIIVFDVVKKEIIKTIYIDTCIGSSFKPHDITASNSFGFVTLLEDPGTPDSDGWIIKYSAETFEELGRIKVGGDPHMFPDLLQVHPNYLYAGSQLAGEVYKIDVDTFEIVDTLFVPGVHGFVGNEFFLVVLNIESSDGKDSMYAIDLRTFTITPNSPHDAVAPNPHNIMGDLFIKKLFISHSSSHQISAYDIDLDTGSIINGRIVFDEPGSMPFGVMPVIEASTACNAQS